MPSKVIFLGAGASKDAGYPLTVELYDLLKQDHENSLFGQNKNAWAIFDEALSDIRSKYPDFENCKDIEYLLTILSLLHKFNVNAAKIKTWDQTRDKKFIEKALESNSVANIQENIIRSLARCIESSLTSINSLMQRDAYQYLDKFYNKELSNGGTIITTNYDLLVERCLNDSNLWSPHAGYGFAVTFSDDASKYTGNTTVIDDYNSRESPTKILKLHGSVGWLNNNDKIILDTSKYSSIIPFGYHDLSYKAFAHDQKHLILPDFIKSYQSTTMLDIWSQAQQAILDTDEIHIVGFSLPEYDANIRTLLLPLRAKLNKQKCAVKIYLRKTDTNIKERWDFHLGDGIQYLDILSFKEYCELL